MKHKYPELEQRDSYQIGDWVLNNGKPYQWAVDDYNRSRMDMQGIQPMPMSMEVIVESELGIKERKTVRDILCETYYTYDVELSSGAKTFEITIIKYTYKDGRKPRYILNVLHNYDQHDHRFSGKINNVHELQSALRSVQLYNIAESIDLKQAETYEQD